MDLQIKDKVYLVTGGGSGIGGGISNQGETLMAPVRLQDSFRAEVRSLQPRMHFIQLELTDEHACADAVQETVAMYDRIDGLVNCAGGNDNVGLETGVEAFRVSLERNLVHYYTMAHYCIEELKKSKGSILNVSSKTALTGQGGTSGYTAAKGAILSLTREWAASYLKDGIRVNAVVPAEVWTPLYERWVSTFPRPAEKLETIVRNIPLGHRMTTVEELADMSVFLLSPLSSHTTGQWVVVDGGYTHLDRTLTAR